MAIRVEVLASSGDPAGAEAAQRAQRAIERLRADAAVFLIPVESAEDAARLEMRGSPTVRVRGLDLDEAPPPLGLAPRRYRDGAAEDAAPPVWLLEAALVSALRPRRVLILSAEASAAALAGALFGLVERSGAEVVAACLEPGLPCAGARAALAELGLAPPPVVPLEEVALERVEAVILLGAVAPPEPVRLATRCLLAWPGVDAAPEAPLEALRACRDALLRRLRAVVGRAAPRALGVAPRGATRSAQAERAAELRVRQAWAAQAAFGEGSASARLEVEALEAECAALEARAQEDGAPLPMERLRWAYRLERLDEALLWLLLAAGQRGSGPALTLGQCAHLLGGVASTGAVVAALSASGALARGGLVVVRGEGGLLMREASLAPHIAAWLTTGRRLMTPEVARFGEALGPRWSLGDVEVPQVYSALLLPLVRSFLAAPGGPPEDAGPGGLGMPRGAAVVVRGSVGSGRTFALRAVAGSAGCGMLVLDGDRLATAPRGEGVGALEQALAEAEAFGEVVVLRQADYALMEPGVRAALRRGVEGRRVILFLCADASTQTTESIQEVVWLEVGHPGYVAAVEPLWRAHVPPWSLEPPEEELEPLARYASLTPGQIRNAAQLTAHLQEGGAALRGAAADYAARAQLHRGLGQLASAEESRARREDLILPPDVADQVDEIVAAVANRQRVLQQWRLRERLRRGLAITCLFDGDPGTGKTLSAEVIASEVGLRLMRVNISSIVDKYIGETEKNLTKLFDRARPDLHLLMFDEADSLFSKRSSKIERSTDRYSNMDINVLLQLIERFEGVAVLTTNLKAGIDPAFERRISFKVHFPMPDEDARRQIWQRLFPEAWVPTSEAIDYDYLATFELAGGAIKNAVLRAAYKAARQNVPLSTDTLVEAAIEEVRAAGHLVRDAGMY